MFQNMVRITPASVSSEIDTILRLFPTCLASHLEVNPERRDFIIREIMQQLSLNGSESHSHAQRPSQSVCYVPHNRLHFLTRYTLLQNLNLLEAEALEQTAVEEPVVDPRSTQSYLSFETLFSDEELSFNYNNSDLSNANLRNVDLSFSNLQGANLTGADLQGANLSGADLRKANLIKANFNGAKLRGANLSGAQIAIGSFVGADLSGAILVETSLDAALFSQACLRGADLRGAYLIGADFSNSQLHHSYYSSTTHFDKGFNPRQAHMLTEVYVTFGQVLEQLNLLSQSAQGYLGGATTARNWEATRPDEGIFRQFHVKPDSAQLQFFGSRTKYLAFSELEQAQVWVNHFISHCTKLIRDFPRLLEKSHMNYMLSTL